MTNDETVKKFDFSKVNILIGLPCFGGKTFVQHNRSLRELQKLFDQYHVRHTIAETLTESLIPRARNALANICCFDVDQDTRIYSHLQFLDVDIGFNPFNILQAIAWDKPIVGLPYAAKTTNWNYVVAAVKKGVESETVLSRMGSRPIINTNGRMIPFDPMRPVEFPQLGTGVLLIQRYVFEAFAKEKNRRYRLMDGEKFYGPRDWAYDFFQIGINPVSNYYDSEDYRFCLDAERLGFSRWMLPWAVTSHTGSADFWMDMAGQAQYGIPEPDLLPAETGFVPLTI